MKEKSYLSVVVYLNKNTSYIKSFLSNLNDYLIKEFEHFEIILVNNGSKEESYTAIQSLKEKLGGHASIINLPWRQSIEIAMFAGTSLSVGDFIIEIDSPENISSLSIINKLFKKCTDGYDIVSATPNSRISLLSKLFYKLVKNFSNISINLNSEPIRIITRRALNAALKSKEKIRFRQITYQLTGFISESLVYKQNEKYKANKTIREKISLALEIVLSYTDFGLKLTFSLSLFFLLISIIVGIYTIYAYLYFQQVATGWTTTMLFLSFGFSGFFLITGVLTKYLVMILSETKDRQPYIVRSIKKIK